jgi:hypothetical protein
LRHRRELLRELRIITSQRTLNVSEQPLLMLGQAHPRSPTFERLELVAPDPFIMRAAITAGQGCTRKCPPSEGYGTAAGRRMHRTRRPPDQPHGCLGAAIRVDDDAAYDTHAELQPFAYHRARGRSPSIP